MLDQLVAATEVSQLGTGFIFTEGPIWDHRAQCLYFSDMPGDVRRRWSSGGGVEETRRPANKCNGMVFDAAGNLLVCEHSTSALIRERPDGTTEAVATHFRGSELNSPNDVCVRSDGSIYFSDPNYGRMPGFGEERDCELDFQGVYLVAPDSEDPHEPRLVVAEDEFEQPNGLCFSPDESILYVNDSPRALIRVYDVAADGSLSGGRVFFDGIGKGDLEEGIPDGMKCDELGNVWVTGPGGVWVISPQAGLLGTIPVPENVGNLGWGGEDWRTLFIAASTSVYAIATEVGPAPLPYHPA
jgi:gluconolactonase